MVGRICETGAF